MIAYKFLRAGGTSAFSERQWPPPGTWLDAGAVESCRMGIHACRPRQLPLWLGLGELWEVELGGEIVEDERKVIAERGRLIRPIDAWNADTARAFHDACAAEVSRRAKQRPDLAAFADDAAATPVPSVAAYISARAAELDEGPAGYDGERSRQADWLAAALQLSV